MRAAFDRVVCEQTCFTDDRGEHVVEIVRDAAGEQSNALDTLCLTHVVFQAPAVGDVNEHPIPHRTPIVLTMRDRVSAEPAPLPRTLRVGDPEVADPRRE